MYEVRIMQAKNGYVVSLDSDTGEFRPFVATNTKKALDIVKGLLMLIGESDMEERSIMEERLIKVGSVYEGSRGEARKVTNIMKSSDASGKGSQVTFLVMAEAKGNGQRLRLGEQRVVPMKTFAAWAKKVVG